MKLPSALFVIGTLDCLLDDSVLMSAKWRMSGAESLLKVYPGKCRQLLRHERLTYSIRRTARLRLLPSRGWHSGDAEVTR